MIYCKAYQVRELQASPDWGGPEVEEMSEDDICYIWEDLIVTKSCLEEERKPLFQVRDTWKEFCTSTLKFAVPDDLKERD